MRVEGGGPRVILFVSIGDLEREIRSTARAVQLQQIAERPLARHVEMQRTHADTQFQRALAWRAMKGTFSHIAPGDRQMLQQVSVDAGRNQQC
ncbi:hypothetical protein PSA5_28960 [Pseudomonas syringae pv. actinidiae]|nr:hypothetical protein PSA5_28960 [Pseudomonas syringae pv. actinidiae]